jgi:hypothetical protein
VDTGGVGSTIFNKQAYYLQLRTGAATRQLGGVAGVKLSTLAFADKFAVGGVPGDNIPLYLDPILPPGADGTLSPDIKRFDVDIDLMRGTFAFFSQKHCPGQVVYWTKSGFVVLPMQVLSDGHVQMSVTIDGKKFDALVDTGARSSIISMRAVKKLGITEKSPDLKPLGDKETRYKAYEYPFKTLDFDGLTVTKPNLQVVSDDFMPGQDTDLIIGISVLRRLHLYIAYGEQKFYITPAGAN